MQQESQEQQQGTGAPPANPTQGQQQAQAAMAAAAAQQMAVAAGAQQAAALAAMLPGGVGSAGGRAALALHPALAAMNPGLAAAGMLPVAGPGGTFTFTARPGMQQPFFFPAVPQPMAAAGASASAAAAAAAARRPASRPGSRSASAAAAGKKYCNCKNSRCLKLYCECFASGRYCDGCNCLNCYNNREHEATRQSAVESILERNPNAFRPKIAGGSDSRRAGGARHNKGCNCKKSGCLKKYCECFQAGIVCSEICKCLDCKNYEGSEARDALVSPQSERQGSPMGLRRATRTASPATAATPGARPAFTSPGAVAAAAAAGGGAGLPSLAQLQAAQAAAAQAAATAPPRAATPQQRAAVCREVVQEVVNPRVIDNLAMLLMVVSQEELDRRQLAPAAHAGAGGSAGNEAQPMDVDGRQQAGQQAAGNGQQPGQEEGLAGAKLDGQEAGAAAAALAAAAAASGDGQAAEGLLAAQERLVLKEFRDALRMISRVVEEKVEKRLAVLTAAGQQQLPVPASQAGEAGGFAALTPQLRPAPSGQPAGGMFVSGHTPGQPLVLLPPALMAQQLAAAGQQLGMAVTLQQTSQGLQAVHKSEQQQQEQQQDGSSPAAGSSGA